MRLGKIIVVALLVFVTYIVFSGSISTYDLIAGIITAIVLGTIFSEFMVKKPSKVFNPVRWGWLILYALYYFFIAEVKAHLDVIYRILHPRTPVKPGIVKIPYSVETDYAITSVANSITNTPGTVVIDIDPNEKVYFVHWINIKSLKPDEARKHVSLVFEKFSHKVFD